MLSDGKRRLEEVYNRFKNPFGNDEVINEFSQKLKDKLTEKEEELLRIEEELHNKKKLKSNPPIEEETYLIPSKANTNPSSSTTEDSQHTIIKVIKHLFQSLII